MEMAGVRHRSDLLLEEEDELFGGDDDADAGDTGDTEDDADADADAEDADGSDDAEEEEEEEPGRQLTAKEIEALGPGDIEKEIDSVMTDIFDSSSKSLAAQAAANESIHRNKLSKLLFEAGDIESFDMQHFAKETARYINHYDTLLDVEGMLYNKAKETLLVQFGDQGDIAVADFEEFMARVHGIDLIGDKGTDFVAPVAVGAGGEGGA